MTREVFIQPYSRGRSRFYRVMDARTRVIIRRGLKSWEDARGWVREQNAKLPRASKGVQRNPSSRSRGAADEAAWLLQEFTGATARKEMRAKVRPIKVGLAVGKLSGVMYEATRDGETSQYFHRFKKSSRPLLIADHDGSQIGIVGGRYRFTDRGIVDE